MALHINGVPLDDPQRVTIIAELSGNHGQSYAQAERLVAAAAEAGADIVKVQTFTAEEICADVPILFGHDPAHDAWCQRQGVTRLRELMRKGGFPRAWTKHLKRFAESCGVQFLSTPFSVDAARFLVEDIGVGGLKIASGDLTFAPLLAYALHSGLPTILSTGGATLDEVRCAADVFRTAGGWGGWQRLVLLHCRSTYPCPALIVNLRAIKTLYDRVACAAVGFSDHTLSVDIVPALAVTCGATVYEKHVRLHDDESSIDAAHSLTPAQFRQMVDVIRSTPVFLGDGNKMPHADELHDVAWARRSPADWLRPTQAAREGAWA